MPGSHVLADGLACFRAVTTANCHQSLWWESRGEPSAHHLEAGRLNPPRVSRGVCVLSHDLDQPVPAAPVGMPVA